MKRFRHTPIALLSHHQGAGKDTVAGMLSTAYPQVKLLSFSAPFKWLGERLFEFDWGDVWGPSWRRKLSTSFSIAHFMRDSSEYVYQWCRKVTDSSPDANLLYYKYKMWEHEYVPVDLSPFESRQVSPRDFCVSFGEHCKKPDPLGKGAWPTIWADLLERELLQALEEDLLPVVTDAGFEVELDMLDAYGTKIWLIDRPELDIDLQETQTLRERQAKTAILDMVIDNSGTLDETSERVKDAMFRHLSVFGM